jgi:hypothetical protein
MLVTDMDTAEALKHLQTLINVASKADYVATRSSGR